MNRLTKKPYFVMFLLLLLALPMTVSADSDGPEWRGTVESRPVGTHIGTWIIGGMSFEVNWGTEVEYEYGPLDAGSCAEVEYYVSGGLNIATELEDEEAYKCGGSGGGGGSYAETRGTITSMPASGLIGQWTIGGVTYNATASTYFEQDDGLFAVGACAEVKYNPTTQDAFKIETDHYCGGGSGGGSGQAYVRGTVSSFPAGLVGTWVIDGVSYEATASTYFQQDDGPFVTGACVDVRYNPTTLVATYIETENDCGTSGGGGGYGYAETYGVVSSFPASLVGTWVVGGVSYTATATTQFIQAEGPFVNNACVEVRYNTTTLEAYKIESDLDCNGTGGGDDGGGHGGSYSRVYATVESFPAGLVGSWVANGVSYTADANTRFEQQYGTFAVGSCVEIDYLPTTYVALEIELAGAYNCGGSGGGGGHTGGYLERYGTVDTMPSGMIGTWVIGGVTYEAGVGTQFEYEHGALAVGRCAEVKYIPGTPNVALEIESDDSYHCGSSTSGSYQSVYGTLDSFPATMIGDWVVNGVTYTSDATTLIKQDDGVFSAGACVEVIYQTTNNLALQIETEDPYHCGTSTTPPSDDATSVDINHASGASGSHFVYTGDSLPADASVSILVNGVEKGTALTNSTGWVTFAVKGSVAETATRSAAAAQTVQLVVNGQTVDAPAITIDSAQPLRALPANYSAPVVETVSAPTAISLSGLSADGSSQMLWIVTLLVALLAAGTVYLISPTKSNILAMQG